MNFIRHFLYSIDGNHHCPIMATQTIQKHQFALMLMYKTKQRKSVSSVDLEATCKVCLIDHFLDSPNPVLFGNHWRWMIKQCRLVKQANQDSNLRLTSRSLVFELELISSDVRRRGQSTGNCLEWTVDLNTLSRANTGQYPSEPSDEECVKEEERFEMRRVATFN